MKEAMGGEDRILIGRETECALVSELMSQKKNIVIFGEEGVGKSIIMTHVLREKNPKNFLYSRESKSLKGTLIHSISFHAESKGYLQKKNILTLKKMFYVLLEENPEYVILDQVGWVEPRYYSFLAYLMEREIPLILLAQGIDKEKVGHLWLALYNFEKVEITNLDRSKVEELIKHYITYFDFKIPQPAKLCEEVFHISKGNPQIIKQLCGLATDKKYQSKGYLDVKLMDLDRKIQAAIH